MSKSVLLKELASLLSYDPQTGVLSWKPRSGGGKNDRFNRKYGGKAAGYTSGIYHRILFKRVLFTGHRIAWFMHYGEEPSDQIDHINGDKLDNRISNLRVVGTKENARNRPLRSDNKTGVNGVYPTQFGTWYAQACVDGKNKHIGTFKTFDEAVEARMASQTAIGFHPNHGRLAIAGQLRQGR
jgi:hypothetical protein